MKLFMRSLYDKTKKRAEIGNTQDYSLICLRCAGTMGGKLTDKGASWHVGKCDCCDVETPVTQPRVFIWRT